jgi:hypothetical protein
MNKVALANFKGLSQDGQREDFAKNIRLLLFNDDLSNCTTFSQIYHAQFSPSHRAGNISPAPAPAQ